MDDAAAALVFESSLERQGAIQQTNKLNTPPPSEKKNIAGPTHLFVKFDEMLVGDEKHPVRWQLFR